ncbi:hypothetical protein [Fictibacillus gelatini]|uniref:hypothetical protein n=1 Tax=Fictibacillus gelatini TaxID=225985 RepID=UPI0004036CEF|nr:hypothetical protein [Fictibacillus gelatini]
MRDFKESIRQFQINQDDFLVKAILSRSEVIDVFDNPESDFDYIATHIRSKREKVLRYSKTLRSGNMYYWRNFQRLLSVIYYDLGVKFEGRIYKNDYYLSYFILEPKLFESLRVNYDFIKRKMEHCDFMEFDYTLKRFEKIEKEVQEKVREIRKELDPIIKESLEFALNKVDSTRTSTEIIKYINRAFDSKYADLMLQASGLTRVRRKTGKRVVKKTFHENPVFAILEVDQKWSEIKPLLTTEQVRFMERALSVVENDIRSNDLTSYTCDLFGGAIIKKTYLGSKLGESPELVRQRISRIKKRLK